MLVQLSICSNKSERENVGTGVRTDEVGASVVSVPVPLSPELPGKEAASRGVDDTARLWDGSRQCGGDEDGKRS